MNEWKEYMFCKIDGLTIIDGDRGINYPKQDDFIDEGHCVFLNTGNVTKEGFDFNDVKFISLEKDNILRKGKLKRGDLVLTTRGTVGNVAFYNETVKFENLRINSGMILLRFDETILPSFIYQQVKSKLIQQQFDLFASGTAQPQLPIKDLLKVTIKLPPLQTQQKIANILGTYDELIEVNNERTKILEETAQSLYKEWFVRFRFPNYQDTEFIKGVPKGWEVKEIGDLAEVTSSKRVFLEDYVEEGIPFFRGKEITLKSNNESINDPLFISVEKYEDIKIRFGIPSTGDLLITAVGTIGNVYLVKESDGDFYFKDGNLIWLRNINNESLSTFFFSYLRTDEMKSRFDSVAIGSSQKALTISSIKKLKLLLPEHEILIIFHKIVSPMFTQIETLQQQNTELRQIRDRLLPRLISGKLLV